MNLSGLDYALWTTGAALQIALALVLVVRSRWRQFPIFAAAVTFQSILTTALFLSYKLGNRNLYFWIFWLSSILDLAFQLGIVFEISRIVLKPTGTWVRDARRTFIVLGALGALLAVGLSFAVSPKSPTNLGAWLIKADLFTTLLIAELFVAMMFSAHMLGLAWRNHVMGLAQGLGLWAMIALVVETLQSYVGWTHPYILLDHIRIAAYDVALVYWTITFWLPEPERKPLSPEMRDYLLALHEKVRYDLSTVRSARTPR